MLKITSGYIITTINYELHTDVKRGDVVQLAVADDKITVIKSNGSCPIGIVLKKMKIVNKKDRSIKKRLVKVSYQRALFKTDNYDPSQAYSVNANLFINEQGQFTTKQNNYNSPAVGLVVEPPTATDNLLHVFWF